MPEEARVHSTKANVIHILLDAVQADVFADVLRGRPDLQKGLAGFIWFRNALGSFPRTHMTLPVIFSDRGKNPGEPIFEHHEIALGEEAFYSKLHARGHAVHLTQMVVECSGAYTTCYKIPLPFDAQSSVPRAEALQLIDYALFRSVPHSLKRFVYNSQRWLLRRLSARSDDPSAHLRFFNHLRFLRDYGARIRTNDDSSTYHFLHLNGSHAPLVSNERCEPIEPQRRNRASVHAQSACVLDSLVSFLGQLRDAGIFDTSTIIVHSDHGVALPVRMRNAPADDAAHPVGVRKLSTIAGKALPLILVKQAGASGALAISNAAATLADIGATAVEGLGETASRSSLFAIAAGHDRTERRIFHDIGVERGLSLQRYEVTGDVYDFNAWRLDEPVLADRPPPSRLQINSAEARHWLLRGWSTRFNGTDRAWAHGPSAALALGIPQSPARLSARIKAWNTRHDTQVEVRVNGTSIGEWELAPSANWQELSLDLPADPQRTAASVVELTFSRYRRPAGRDRPPSPIAAAIDWIAVKPLG